MTNGRNKGKAYENHITSLFREIGFGDAKRHLEYQFQEAEAGRDIDHTEPFAVQVKCWKSTPSIQAMEQITIDDTYNIRTAILKRTQSKGVKSLEVAVVDLPVFLEMVRLLKKFDLLGEIVDGIRQ